MTDTAIDSGAFTVVLPKEYPLILLSCVVLCIECFLIGMCVVAPKRFKYFNKEFMDQFNEEHEAAFPGTKPAVGGFPDAGEGRYAAKLPYEAQMKFNYAMRVHMNFVEQLPMLLSILCISGLFIPKVTMYVGFINAGARIIYTIMYVMRGGNYRVLGAVAGSLPLYGLAIATMVFAIKEVAK